MLIKHTAYYLLAKGLPGLVNFVALAVYTRLLTPEEFGRYALVLAGIGLANVAIFQWLRLVLLRFLQAHASEPHRFLAGVFALFLMLALAATGLGLLLAIFWPAPFWRHMLALAIPLLLVQAWFELNLELVRARLAPLAYGKLLNSKALIAISVGVLLAWVGLGAAAPILGLFAGYALAFVLFGLAAWKGVRPAWPAATELRTLLSYGLPLTITFALAWVVSSSDRLILAWFLDEGAVGVYSAGYDLVFQAITLLLVIINTAAHPLAVKALEQHGMSAATEQLRQNGELICVVALTAAATLISMSPSLVPWLIGESFRVPVLQILPWIALASALAGIKAYYFDMAFHLGRRSYWLVVTGILAALTNVALNFILIPLQGITGAAVATFAAYGLAITTSYWFGARVFPMPSMLPLLVKGLLIAAATGGLTHWLLPVQSGLLAQLAAGVGTALTSSALLIFLFNVSDVRTRARVHLWKT